MNRMDNVKKLINKLYGHHAESLDNVPDVMGMTAANRKEMSNIKANGYQPVQAAEADSHNFSYDNLGYASDAIRNARQDIQDIQNSETAQASGNSQADIDFDKQQIQRDQKFPADELVMISRLNNGKITRPANPADVEMIYHNTHSSSREILERHPNLLAYMTKDAEIDAKRDLG